MIVLTDLKQKCRKSHKKLISQASFIPPESETGNKQGKLPKQRKENFQMRKTEHVFSDRIRRTLLPYSEVDSKSVTLTQHSSNVLLKYKILKPSLLLVTGL